MARQIVFTDKAPKPPPAYSQAVKAAGLVFLSGTFRPIPIRAPSRGRAFRNRPGNA